MSWHCWAAFAGLPLKILHPPQGAAALKEHGTPIPEETKRAAREADGVLFGAAGPSSSAVVSWLRWEMEAYAGVRPVRFACSPCAVSARRIAFARSAIDAYAVVAASTRPGQADWRIQRLIADIRALPLIWIKHAAD